MMENDGICRPILKRPLPVLFLLALVLVSCKKPTPPVPVPTTPSPSSPVERKDIRDNPAFAKLAPWLQKEFLEAQAQGPFNEEEEAKDRREMVRPAPRDFKPERVEKKIKLTLIPQKNMIRKDEFFWYILELQNVGTGPVRITDKYFKVGDIDGLQIKFRVTGPDGKKMPVATPFVFDDMPCGRREFRPTGAESMNKSQFKEAVERENRRRAAQHRLSVVLQPGETLSTRPWEHVQRIEWCRRFDRGEDVLAIERPAGPYRQFWVDGIDQPGTYRITAVYDDIPAPLDERHVQRMIEKFGHTREDEMKYYRSRVDDSLGHFESNTVLLEVVP